MCSIIRTAPCAPLYGNYLITPSINNTGSINFHPPLQLEAGVTYDVPNFYTQTWASHPDQALPSSLLADAKWNSWVSDPIDVISDITRTTKNGSIISGKYYVEYAYSNKAQNVLTAASGQYSIGDAQDEPQNLFTILKDDGGSGKDSNSWTLAGFKHGSTVTNEIYYFQMKMFMCRFKFFTDTVDPAVAETHYNMVFVPISTGTSSSGSLINYFHKILASNPIKPTDVGQILTNSVTYLEQFGSGSKQRAISDATWDAQNPATTTLIVRLASSHSTFDSTQFSDVVESPSEKMLSSCTLSPEVTYGLLPIISPQVHLGGSIISANLRNYDLVFRMSMRGWILFIAGVTDPALSQIFVYNVNPNVPIGLSGAIEDSAFEAGNCVSTKVTAVSGTTSSSSGVPGISFQPASDAHFWLRSVDRNGIVIPSNILGSLPSNIVSHGDYQSNYPYSAALPKFDLSFVFDSTDSILGNNVNDLLQLGSTRISYDEGASWSNWVSMGDKDAYINAVNYLGLAPQPKFPGQAYTFNGVDTPSTQCNGVSTITTDMNSFVEVTFPITA